jgi:hypothetical protein
MALIMRKVDSRPTRLTPVEGYAGMGKIAASSNRLHLVSVPTMKQVIDSLPACKHATST